MLHQTSRTSLHPDAGLLWVDEAPCYRPAETATQHDVHVDNAGHRPAQRLDRLRVVDQRAESAETGGMHSFRADAFPRLGLFTVTGSNNLVEEIAQRMSPYGIRLPMPAGNHAPAASECEGVLCWPLNATRRGVSEMGRLRIQAPLRRKEASCSGASVTTTSQDYGRLPTAAMARTAPAPARRRRLRDCTRHELPAACVRQPGARRVSSRGGPSGRSPPADPSDPG